MNSYKEPMQDSISDNSTITQPTTLTQTTPQITPETTLQDHSRLFLIIEMFQKLKILITGFDDLLDIEIPRTHFLQPSLVNDFLQFIPRQCLTIPSYSMAMPQRSSSQFLTAQAERIQ